MHGVNLTFGRNKESVCLASRLCDGSVETHITSLIFLFFFHGNQPTLLRRHTSLGKNKFIEPSGNC